MSICCCLPLRPVGIALGFLFLVGSLFMAALSGIALYDLFENSTAAYSPTMNTKEYMDLETIPLSSFVEENLPRVAFLFGHSAITVICSLMLIYGSLSRRRYFLIPHLLSEAVRYVSLSLFCAQQIYNGLNPPMEPKSHEDTPQAAFTSALVYFALFVFFLYLWMCIFALFHHFRKGRRQTHLTPVPYIYDREYSPMTRL